MPNATQDARRQPQSAPPPCNVRVWLAYQGTRYAGFQVQPNGLSVCAVFQNALEALLGARPDVKGCSRTDAGVHALRFALNFWYAGRVPVARLPAALNAHLPPDVRVLAAEAVPPDFHARYAAHEKTYCYRLRNAPVDLPFDAAFVCRIWPALELDAMRRAAAGFVGTHDFLALCAVGSSAAAHGDTVRTVSDCRVLQSADDPARLTVTVTANGYLYHMVRILAGTVVAAGQGRFDPDFVPALLASRNRRLAGPTLPARGLFLTDVRYGDGGPTAGQCQ